MTDPLTRVSLAIMGAAIGGSILLLGRKYYWFLLGVMCMMVTAYFLATLQGLDNEVLLVTEGYWAAVLISLGAGLVGLFVGRWRHDTAVLLIGFVAGVYLATLFDHILLFLSGSTDTELTWWLLVIFAASGVLGAYLTRRNTSEALILISVALGTTVVSKALGLPNDLSLTAVLTLSLALVGIVVQFAAYVRETPRARSVLPAVPAPGSEDLPY